MGGSEFRAETRNYEHQERTTEGFRSRLLLLRLCRRSIPLKKRFGKRITQTIAPLRRDNYQAPRVQTSMIRGCTRCPEYLLNLLAIRTGVSEPFGRNVLARMQQRERRLQHFLVIS